MTVSAKPTTSELNDSKQTDKAPDVAKDVSFSADVNYGDALSYADVVKGVRKENSLNCFLSQSKN